MAPMPARVAIVPERDPAGSGRLLGYRAEVDPADLAARKNPGFPFFVPGIASHRAPHPPLDFAPNPDYRPGDPAARRYLDGGLARHLILDGNHSNEHHNQWDFSKDTDEIAARELPEGGTPVERVAMAFHSTPKPWIPSYTQTGRRGFFEVNGLPAASGAPFANPGRDLAGNAVGRVRRYQAADLQTDVVFSKKGWHYPQERHIALWDDVAPTVSGERAPEPLFFRANSQTDVICTG
jgi:manganese oxidase